MDIDAVRPFWEAVLGYRPLQRRPGGPVNLVDPARLGPAVWFQQMDEPRPDRNRIHVDVTVAHDVAAARVEAALAAGGVLVSDADARSWWVLADVEGNEVVRLHVARPRLTVTTVRCACRGPARRGSRRTPWRPARPARARRPRLRRQLVREVVDIVEDVVLARLEAADARCPAPRARDEQALPRAHHATRPVGVPGDAGAAG